MFLCLNTVVFAQETVLPKWQEGYLEIHHINTGSGDASFYILPDGTTVLFDAGDMDSEGFEDKYHPLKSTHVKPNDSKNSGEWVVNYINQVYPQEKPKFIDYGIISHFHTDHYGLVKNSSLTSTQGNYKLTGFTQVNELIPFKTIIDRAAPNYTFPVNLKEYYGSDKSFQNYLKFASVHINKKDIRFEGVKVGSSSQVRLNNTSSYPNFKAQFMYANGKVWDENENETRTLFTADSVLIDDSFNENPLSIALKITYGDFDYFTGGDMTGLQGYGLPKWFNVETPVSKVVKEIDVLASNHHGNRDATNKDLLENTKPRVIVNQTWCSDHPGQEVVHRINYYSQPTDVFSTNVHEETLVTLGPWMKQNYKSYAGHILVRVLPGGKSYEVFILDDTKPNLTVKAKFGPYKSNK